MLEIRRFVSGDRIEREIHIHHGGSENTIEYDSDDEIYRTRKPRPGYIDPCDYLEKDILANKG
jgi:hypothetical protein